jgi:hypothetical protein
MHSREMHSRDAFEMHLSDDEVRLVELQLGDAEVSCWRSVCDFACVSRRTAASLLSQGLWHAAALSYMGTLP